VRAFRLFPNEEEEERLEEQARRQADTLEPAVLPLAWWWTLVLWSAALLPRLYTLFSLTDPENAGDGWHGDVYHHWQIAYLTKQIGLFAPGGPRLWDLKGLEYYWGILHPIVMVGLFFVTGSIDIVLARLLSLVCGAGVVVLIFHLCRRYWGTRVAIAAAGFAAVAPVPVFVDSTGFLEPMGVALCLLGLWMWPRRGAWSGVFWALAAMARAEAWIFSAGLVVATLLRRAVGRSQRIPLLIAWLAGILVYMKIMLDRTGNPIYPVYWNYVANAAGAWEFRDQLDSAQLAVRPLLGALLILAAAGLGFTLWKRPRGYMFLTFGFGYLVFTFGFLGFTAYLKSWETWFWMERFFAFPYEFAAVLAAIGLFVLLPKVIGPWVGRAAWAVMGAGVLLTQLAWGQILPMYDGTKPVWQETLTAGRYIGTLYQQAPYQGSVLNLPNANPSLTYVLARFDGVDGSHLIGQLYDPFYYLPQGVRYVDHPQAVGTLMQCWLAKTQTRLLLVEAHNGNYLAFMADHPDWVTMIGQVPGYQWLVEDVHVPPPAPQACDRAARSLTP
jgi:hypothetical protein